MPPRQADQRRTSSGDAVRDASARLEELRSDVGKGSGALRNRARQTMVLSPSSQVPLLEPRQDGVPVGTAMRWGSTGVELVDSSDSAYRDLALRGLDARGDVQTSGTVRAGYEIIAEGGMRANGGLSTAGAFVADLDSTFKRRVYVDNLSVTGNSVWSFDRDNAWRWSTDTAFESCNRAGTEFRGVRCSRVAEVGATSWSWSKTGHQTLDEALGMTPGEFIDQVAARVTSWRHDPDVVPDVATGEQRVGLMLDDLPDILVDRNLIPERVETTVHVPVIDDEGKPTGETRPEVSSVETGVMLDRSTWDLRGVVSTLLVELASLRARVADLEAGAA